MSQPAMTRSRAAGLLVLAVMLAASFAFGRVWPEVAAQHCPFGHDVLRPDQTVCELAFGGLWVSMLIGLGAGALATGFGLIVALGSRAAGGLVERTAMAFADAFFSLPDVLVLMVLQLAGQTWGDLRPALKLPPWALMVVSLGLIGWAAPARIFRDRLLSLEGREFVTAARALGGTRSHLLLRHLLPDLAGDVMTLFLSRVPAAILAESTVSFFGIARVEPMSLGRYLGTSYSALVYQGGARVVLPAWALLVIVVLAVNLAAGSAFPGRRQTSPAKGR